MKRYDWLFVTIAAFALSFIIGMRTGNGIAIKEKAKLFDEMLNYGTKTLLVVEDKEQLFYEIKSIEEKKAKKYAGKVVHISSNGNFLMRYISLSKPWVGRNK